MSDQVHHDGTPAENEAPRPDELFEELPWAEPEPDDVQPFEDLVAESRRRRGRLVTAGLVVAGLALIGLVSVAWLGGDDPSEAEGPQTTIPSAPAPTTTTTEPDALPAFEVTDLEDGWYRVTAADGSMTADLPAAPRVQASATSGLVHLVAELEDGALAELLWSPQRRDVPPELGPYLAMIGAGDRYRGVESSSPREVDGAVVIDGRRETGADLLRARSVSREGAVAMVLFVAPSDVAPAVLDAAWDRMIDTLRVG